MTNTVLKLMYSCALSDTHRLPQVASHYATKEHENKPTRERMRYG